MEHMTQCLEQILANLKCSSNMASLEVIKDTLGNSSMTVPLEIQLVHKKDSRVVQVMEDEYKPILLQ